MVNLNNVNRDNVAEPMSFDPVEPGWYAMQITEAEQKTSSAGHDYLNLTFEFDENYHPELKGRKVWQILSLWHPDSKTQAIANGQLGKIEEATIGQPANDTQDLMFRTMSVKLKIETQKGYEPKNRPNGWEPLASRFGGGNPAPAPAQAQQPQQRPAPQPQGGGTPPWAR